MYIYIIDPAGLTVADIVPFIDIDSGVTPQPVLL